MTASVVRTLQQVAADQRRFFDNTMLKDYKDCPRRYFLRHIKGWRKEGTGTALVFGLSWHAAMDIVWEHFGKCDDRELLTLAAGEFDRTWVECGLPLDMDLEQLEKFAPRTPMVAREMLVGYLEKRRHILENCELVACEQPFAVPLPMDSAAPGSTWYAGRLDKVFRHQGSLIVGEHKSTTEYKIDGGFKTQYLQSWYLDSQIMGYLYGGGLFFEGLEQVWVDAALVHKKVHDAFKFIPVSHKFSMLEQWIHDVLEWVHRVYRDEEKFALYGNLRKGIFPKQQESCVGKYGMCQFVDICRTEPDPSQLDEPPPGFVQEKWSPFDVLKLDKLLQQEG